MSDKGEQISYEGDEYSIQMSEEEWLYLPDVVDSWFVYLKDWPAGAVTESIVYDGTNPLAYVVHDIHDEFIEGVREKPCVYISPEPIERFYPDVKHNEPPEVAFFDGGGWYWAQDCESGLIGQVPYEEWKV